MRALEDGTVSNQCAGIVSGNSGAWFDDFAGTRGGIDDFKLCNSLCERDEVL